MTNRKNDNDRYVWYADQSFVDFAESLIKDNKVSPHRIGFSYGSCRVPKGIEYELLHDSDGFIRAIRELDSGLTYM